MTVTSGPECSEPFAFYDPDSSCWRTSQGTFPWDSGVFSATWPKQGTTRSGRAYAAPISGHLTDASGCSLLPTPAAQEPGGTVEQYHDRLREMDGREPTFTPLGMLVQLLPTPRTSDTNGSGQHGDGGPDLRTAVGTLLPTPQTAYTATSVEEWRARRPAGNGATRETVGDLRLVVEELIGAPTSQPFGAGNTSSAEPPPTPLTTGDD